VREVDVNDARELRLEAEPRTLQLHNVAGPSPFVNVTSSAEAEVESSRTAIL